jgi:hypothetical protein
VFALLFGGRTRYRGGAVPALNRRFFGDSPIIERRGMVMGTKAPMEVQVWPIDKVVFYARNPRKNDAAVDCMCGSIREFGFKIPCLVRSDGEVIDGHAIYASKRPASWASQTSRSSFAMSGRRHRSRLFASW